MQARAPAPRTAARPLRDPKSSCSCSQESTPTATSAEGMRSARTVGARRALLPVPIGIRPDERCPIQPQLFRARTEIARRQPLRLTGTGHSTTIATFVYGIISAAHGSNDCGICFAGLIQIDLKVTTLLHVAAKDVPVSVRRTGPQDDRVFTRAQCSDGHGQRFGERERPGQADSALGVHLHGIV